MCLRPLHQEGKNEGRFPFFFLGRKMQETNGKSEKFAADVEKATSSIEGFADAVGDADSLVEGVFSLAKAEGRKNLMTQIAGDLTEENIKRSLGLMTDDPDEFLSSIGIEVGLSGLDYSESEWISNGEEEKGNVRIVVTYTMKNVLFPDFDFGQYEFSQSASTLIW